MTDITEITAEKLEEIRQRYRPTEVPKCHICGAEMTIQRMSASRITYGCAGAVYDETGCHYAEGRSLADDHYAESRITVVDVSDPEVLTLVEAFKQLAAENVALKAGVSYFSYGSEHNFEWHKTAKEAVEAAEAAIDDYRGDACDGWSEEVDSICWGIIMQSSTKVGERPRNEDDRCDPAIDTVCDYTLLPNIETPATDRIIAEAEARGVENVHYADAAEMEIAALRQRIAELEEAEQKLCAANVTLDARAELAERQLAEMESRTVKLPEVYGYLREKDGQIQISIGAERPSDRSGGYATPWFAIYTAAGIKVIEGDQKNG